jgi:hypothetical protein
LKFRVIASRQSSIQASNDLHRPAAMKTFPMAPIIQVTVEVIAKRHR